MPIALNPSIRLIAFSFIVGGSLLLGGCTRSAPVPTPLPSPSPSPSPAPTSALISESEAREEATAPGSACVAAGKVGETEVYNPNSETWWFTLTPTEPKPGCNPACLVAAPTENGQDLVTINWRCTGLQLPD